MRPIQSIPTFAMRVARLALPLFATLLTGTAQAALLTVQVTDAAGAAAADAVVYLDAGAGQALPRQNRPSQIEQKGRTFIPNVTVVQTGSGIAFPNRDTVRHQVYSFSPAKVFELKLYSGGGGEPLLFDKPGTVVIGCNIHDKMSAYIQVVDTPYFGKSDAAGKVVIENLPAGKYLLKVWHRALAPGEAVPEQPLTIGAADVTVPVSLNRK